MRVLVSYDVVLDRRRTRVARCLESYGLRVQYSVFECELTVPIHARLVAELEKLIEPAEDSLRIYPLCARCVGMLTTMGREAPAKMEDDGFFF